MDKVKTYLAGFAILIIAVGATYYITKWRANNQIEYIRDNAQQRIDSISVVKQAVMANRDAIEDSLEALDSKFAEYVTRTNQQINSYTTIIGRLRVEKDSIADTAAALAGRLAVSELINRDSSVTNTFKDTLINRTKTWSDSLFATDAIAQFQDDSLTLESRLRQLRDIRIDVVSTVSDDQRQVNTFVRSPDFDSLRVNSVTEIKPKAKNKWLWYVSVPLFIKQAVDIAKLIF